MDTGVRRPPAIEPPDTGEQTEGKDFLAVPPFCFTEKRYERRRFLYES